MGFLEMLAWAQVRQPGGGFPSGPPGGGAEGGVAALIGVCCQGIVMLVFVVPQIAGMWKAFAKAGEPGWAAIIPVYNFMVMSKIAGRGEMYGLLVLIPCAGIIFAILILIDFCNKFGQGGGFAAGLILLPFVFWPILGFGSSRYLGAGRRRARDEEEEEEDEPRPRRRRDEDEDDEPPPRPRPRRRDE